MRTGELNCIAGRTSGGSKAKNRKNVKSVEDSATKIARFVSEKKGH